MFLIYVTKYKKYFLCLFTFKENILRNVFHIFALN